MMLVPAAGFRLKQPKFAEKYKLLPVHCVALKATSDGRSVVRLSPLVSRPVVMLYGAPLEIMINGLTEIRHGIGRLVPTTMRCRTSAKLDGPHSARTL